MSKITITIKSIPKGIEMPKIAPTLSVTASSETQKKNNLGVYQI